MGDGFKDRVEKVFGSISCSSSWSLAGGQVQRREWNRPQSQRDDDRIPVFPSFQDDDDDWDIRSSIGLDSTLDNEDEEDAFGKMAQGRDHDHHRLYMKDDVTHHSLFLNSHNLLHHLKRDPLANHHEPMLSTAQPSGYGLVSIKSILKNKTTKTYDEAPNPCKNADAAPRPQEGPTQASGKRPSVPDYILNPSKYTRYTFDDGSNNNTEPPYLEQKSGGELPKSLVFIPRKKRARGCHSQQHSSSTQPCSTLGIAAQQAEISEMQQDNDVSTSQKPIHQYRSKIEAYHDDDDV